MFRFSFIVCVFFLTSAITAWSAPRQTLHSHVPAAAAHAQLKGRLESSKHLNLALGLPLRNQDQLNRLLRDLYDPASPQYHHYLTPQEFADRFGPTEQDYQAVISFAKAHGLAITGTHPNRTLLDVDGSVAGIERTLHVAMRVYRHPKEARDFFAPDVEPSLDLSVPMLSISGLDDYVLPHPMNLAKFTANPTPNATAYVTGSGPRGYFIGKDFRAAYAPGVTLTGSGQSVGLFELDGYYPGDVAAYESLAGLPDVPLTNVLLDGFKGLPAQNNVEVALDIEMAIAMAPGLSNVTVYEGTIPNDVLNRMATDNAARQLSSSWGFGINASTEQIYQQFVAQGQCVFQASGDNGGYANGAPKPSDDPNLVIVGGTSLITTGPAGTWVSESVWSGSGGGISTNIAIPPWQNGIGTSTNHGSATLRNVPDVACLADTIIWIVANNGQQGNIGGTSASAPLWAAFNALVNQQAAANGQPPVGFINPAIYAIAQGPQYAASFHDITAGNNTNFFATAGYDLCTGWGSPTGSNLIAALLAPPDSLQITPPAPFVVSGPVGGPFNPTPSGWSLTNIGANSVNWTLNNTSNWLNVSPASGTQAPGQSATPVTATINPTANSLAPGSYAATIWFTNQNDGFGQSRQIILDVVTPPVITAQPVGQALPYGTTAVFTVGTSANALQFFQWQKDGTNLNDVGNISGSTTATLTITNLNLANDGNYSVIISNAAGTTNSSSASLTVLLSPARISSQPTNQSVVPGATATFNVVAYGLTPVTYQWQFNSNNLSDGGNISGSSTANLSISNASAANAGTYSVIVSNTLGASTSSNAVLSVASVTAPGFALSSIYSFTGGSDGGGPNAMIQVGGNLYGTTQSGGASSMGTVFKMTTGGAWTGLYSFTGGTDGGTPYAPLASGNDGNFYGTTFQGGTNDNGTVFMMTPSGALTNLVSFFGANGDLPFAGLTLGSDGNFYGTTHQGGAGGHGTAYRTTTNGVLTTLISFADSNGGFPDASLTQGADGSFYGTTFLGGSRGLGAAFKIATNGLQTTLVTFGNTNGAFPYAGLTLGVNGNFYGVTTAGGASSNGVIFEVTSAGVFTNLYSFTGGADGANPTGGLLAGRDGNFYGTTANGGTYNDGTIFALTPDGTLTTLAQFDGFNGANPQATLTQGLDGNIYGTTQNGGASGSGTVFRFSATAAPQITDQPAGQTVYLGATVTFNVSAMGAPTLSFQWLENGTPLSDGGNISGSATHALALSNVMPGDAAVYSVIVSNSFGPVTSSNAPLQVLVSAPQITAQPTNQTVAPGAASLTFNVSAIGDLPLIYQWRKNGTNLVDGGNLSGCTTSNLTIVNVTEAYSGSYSVIVSNALGSVTSSNAVLSVVPPSLAGTLMTTLYSFNGDDGATPNGLTLGSDGNLYGTTQVNTPGQHRFGTVFRITTNGVLTTLAGFPGNPIGGVPRMGVIQASDGNFYGSTPSGGNYFSGNIYKMTPAGALANFYSFTGGVDGSTPAALIMQALDGNFYGTMPNGGASGVGNVFKLTPDGTFANVYSFTGGTDGSSPENSIIQASDGNFYGTTSGGIHGDGTIFKLTPNGVISNLYSFTGGTDGSFPTGALVQGTDGSLYGTTRFTTIAGFAFYGTLYKITTNGAFTMLYDLNAGNGQYPYAGLIQGADGNFYGTTFGGGANSDGVVYRMTSSGAYTTLVAFNGFDDGAHPESALVQGPDGSLYGTTTTGGYNGRGTIFRVSFTGAPQITTQPIAQTVIAGANASFNVAVFGASPLFYHWMQNGTNVVDGGVINGSGTRILTLQGVAPANAGTYSVVVSNALGSVTSSGAPLTVNSSAPIITQQPVSQTVLPAATATLTVGAIGSPPLSYQWRANSTNLLDGGNISGSATSTLTISNISEANAGNYTVVVSNSLGTATSTNVVLSVPSLMPAGVVLTGLYSFTGGNDGGNPNGVIQASNGTFYGSTTFGGTGSSGSVFQFSAGGPPTTLYSFTNGNDGGFPCSVPLLSADGNLYGTTFEGGAFADGVVYQLTTGGTFANVYSFTGTKDGANPQSALIRGSDGNFYGTATSAGGIGHGDVFRMILGGAFTGIHSFTGGSDGSVPIGALMQGADGNLYGTTSGGGANGSGAVFKMTTNGAVVWSVSLNLTNGANPQAGLAPGPDGNFYGTTAGGGANGLGTVFKVTPGGVLTRLYSFSALVSGTNSDGASPRAALVLGSDGNFYGAAANGGPYGDGTVFKITTAGALTTLAWFDGFNGANPDSALVQGLDNDFYGTTSAGGASGSGVIYQLSAPLPFAFQNIQRNDSLVTMIWSSAAGQMYQLQYKTDLLSTNWTNLGNVVTATGSSTIATDTILPGMAQRFYRVVLVP